MENEIDYKFLFRHFFERAIHSENNHDIENFLDDEALPFPLCEEAVRKCGKRLSDFAATLVASRKDCPDEFFAEICESRKLTKGDVHSENFVDMLCKHCFLNERRIPEDMLEGFIKKGLHVQAARYPDMSDRLKRKIAEKIGLFDDDFERRKDGDFRLEYLKKIHFQIHQLVVHQRSLPDDCMKVLERLLKYFEEKDDLIGLSEFVSHNGLRWMAVNQMMTSIRMMKKPLEDSHIDEIFDGQSFSIDRIYFAMQAAANPSISDYAIMEILMKSTKDKEMLERLNKILNENEEKREQYRRLNPKLFAVSELGNGNA